MNEQKISRKNSEINYPAFSKAFKIVNIFGANLPVMLLFWIVFFLYTTYFWTFLIELFKENPKFSSESSQFQKNTAQSFMEIYESTKSFLNIKPNDNKKDLSNLQTKGIFYSIILHLLIFLLLWSVLKTIFTKPGAVPNWWHEQTGKELSKYFEIEQNLLKQLHKKKKKNVDNNLNLKLIEEVTSPENIEKLREEDKERRLMTELDSDEEEAHKEIENQSKDSSVVSVKLSENCKKQSINKT